MKDAKDDLSTHVTVTLQYHSHTTHIRYIGYTRYTIHTSVTYNCTFR